MKLKLLSSLALALPLAMYGQAPATQDAPYQVNYASNLNLADSVVNFTNGGASAGDTPIVVGGNNAGDICANIYVYAPDQEQATCCTCKVTPNGLYSAPVSFGPGNLLANAPQTPAVLNIRSTNSLVIKVLFTAASGIGGAYGTDTCPRPDAPNAVALGGIGWATHAHPTNTNQAALTETQFVPTTLGAGEYSKLTTDCNYNLTRGSQVVCPGCRTGGLTTAIN